MKLNFSVICLIVFGIYACKAQDRMATDTIEFPVKLKEAAFTRWSGGQSGVKGIFFDIEVECISGIEEILIQSFKVNSIDLKLEKVQKEGNLITIRSIYTYPREKVLVGESKLPLINSINVPETGEIVFNLGGIFHQLRIDGFKEIKSSDIRNK